MTVLPSTGNLEVGTKQSKVSPVADRKLTLMNNRQIMKRNEPSLESDYQVCRMLNMSTHFLSESLYCNLSSIFFHFEKTEQWTVVIHWQGKACNSSDWQCILGALPAGVQSTASGASALNFELNFDISPQIEYFTYLLPLWNHKFTCN